MFLKADLETLPHVLIMGQVQQSMGFSNAFMPEMHILILLRSGDMTFTFDHHAYTLTDGHWLLIPQGQAYQVSSRQGCQYAYIHFSLAQPLELMEKAPSMPLKNAPSTFVHSLPHSAQDHWLYLSAHGQLSGAQEKIWAMLTECDMHRYALTPSRKLRIDLRFAEMLSLLDARNATTALLAYPPALSRMLEFIHEHYAQPITLTSLSEEFQLSRQYIMRLFEKHLHLTVTHYITRLKMAHAQELLRYSSFRIGDVAEMLGFSSAYYFCRVFRRQFGMTPTEYIRQGVAEE